MSAPMFALASVISISSVARSCATALVLPEPKYVSMEQVAELFLLTRGVRTVVEACGVWLHASQLAPILKGYDIPHPDEITLPDSIRDRFKALNGMIETNVPDMHQKRICKEAIMHLEGIYRSVSHYDAKDRLQTGHVFTWMTSIPSEFVMFIQASLPPALVILAHFASVSLAARSAWYSRNWGNYCLQGISMELRGHELQPWLEWPRAHAETNMAILTPLKADAESPIAYRIAEPPP
ncbi:hypothetical protein Slin14017_G091620 [Septoria linicola]|nr:hypothetical protein Slin14017_G091620 [Septoria linicola]